MFSPFTAFLRVLSAAPLRGKAKGPHKRVFSLAQAFVLELKPMPSQELLNSNMVMIAHMPLLVKQNLWGNFGGIWRRKSAPPVRAGGRTQATAGVGGSTWKGAC